MTRLFLSFLVCGSSLLATAAAPRPVSFMDGAVKYDAEGRLTSVDNISGINIFNVKYTPVMGPDTTEYSGVATLVMEAMMTLPTASISISILIPQATYHSSIMKTPMTKP